MKTMFVFSIAFVAAYLLLVISAWRGQWDGASMNYMFTTAIVPSFVAAIVVAGMYYSYTPISKMPS